MWLRFVQGRPVSAVTTQFLDWCCEQLAQAGKRVLVLIWDNATWHRSQLVRTWLHTHNQQVKQSGTGVRILSCLLPTKSPWLNPIEAKWVHGKKNVVEADRLLTASELESRVYAYFACSPESRLAKPEKVA
jgi:transposase